MPELWVVILGLSSLTPILGVVRPTPAARNINKTGFVFVKGLRETSLLLFCSMTLILLHCKTIYLIYWTCHSSKLSVLIFFSRAHTIRLPSLQFLRGRVHPSYILHQSLIQGVAFQTKKLRLDSVSFKLINAYYQTASYEFTLTYILLIVHKSHSHIKQLM